MAPVFRSAIGVEENITKKLQCYRKDDRAMHPI